MTVIERSDGRDGRPRGDEGREPVAGGDPVAVRLRRRGWAVVVLAVLLLAAVLRVACYLTVLQAPAGGEWVVAAGSAAPDDSRAVDPWGPHPWRVLRLPWPGELVSPAPVPPASVRATLVSQGPGQDPGQSQPER